MKVSVVIVNFNSDKEIKKLRTEISSSPNIEKIFVIDNSPPNKNLGFAAAINIGIKRALKNGADKVLLLNPDLKITKENINDLDKSDGNVAGPVLKFKRNKNTVLDYGGKVNLFLGRAKHNEVVFQTDTAARASDSGRGQNDETQIDYISGACMMIKKEVIEKIGLFDERFFMYFEDVDFCLRAKKAGYIISIEPNIVVEHQISEHKFSKNPTKRKYLARSNSLFIQKWVPWQFKPVAKFYLALISLHLKFS